MDDDETERQVEYPAARAHRMAAHYLQMDYEGRRACLLRVNQENPELAYMIAGELYRLTTRGGKP